MCCMLCVLFVWAQPTARSRELQIEQGAHLSHPKVHIQKIRGLKLKTDSSDKIGHIANDGELLACGNSQKQAQYQSPMNYHTQFELIVQPRLVQVFALPAKVS